jgi:hypothetical protein
LRRVCQRPKIAGWQWAGSCAELQGDALAKKFTVGSIGNHPYNFCAARIKSGGT